MMKPMSAFGPFRQILRRKQMSASRGKADVTQICGEVAV
jgi:hypothetical protein